MSGLRMPWLLTWLADPAWAWGALVMAGMLVWLAVASLRELARLWR